MPMKILPKKSGMFLLLSACLLAGCHPFVQFPHSSRISKHIAADTAGGAATGAVLGSTGIGALAGAGVGVYTHSTVYWLKKLQSHGVQVIQTGYLVKIVIPSDKIFIINTDSILPRSYPILTDVARFVQNYGHVNVTVSGFTDNVGSTAASLRLSIGQAKSVLAYLWSSGIPSSNIKAVGYGQADPIADNFDSIGSAWNRRIEVSFAYG